MFLRTRILHRYLLGDKVAVKWITLECRIKQLSILLEHAVLCHQRNLIGKGRKFKGVVCFSGIFFVSNKVKPGQSSVYIQARNTKGVVMVPPVMWRKKSEFGYEINEEHNKFIFVIAGIVPGESATREIYLYLQLSRLLLVSINIFFRCPLWTSDFPSGCKKVLWIPIESRIGVASASVRNKRRNKKDNY